MEHTVNPLPQLLGTLPQHERSLVEEGFNAVRGAVTALARHSPNIADPFQGRLIDVQTDIVGITFKRVSCSLALICRSIFNLCCFVFESLFFIDIVLEQGGHVTLRTIPPREAQLGLRSPWLAYVIMENAGRSKEVEQGELQPIMKTLRA